jgi:hypothetical protein
MHVRVGRGLYVQLAGRNLSITGCIYERLLMTAVIVCVFSCVCAVFGAHEVS